jgi:hypothetical protein
LELKMAIAGRTGAGVVESRGLEGVEEGSETELIVS